MKMPMSVVALSLAALATGCSSVSTAAPEVAPQVTSTADRGPLCTPSMGSPKPSATCPAEAPQTGWLTVEDDALTLRLFRTLGNDAEGRAYAEAHGEEFPFPNDYFDAPTGDSRALVVEAGTVCTGVILVDHREPLADHVVDCGLLTEAARRGPVPVAAWAAEGHLVQVSELYRP